MIMKILLSVCSILFLLCTNSAALRVSNVVLDTWEHEVKVGSKYYIFPAAWNPGGGGFGLSNLGNVGSCTDTVTREPCDNDLGIPVSFHPANPDESVIHLSKSLNLKYEASVPCGNSTVWRVGRFDAWLRSNLVEIGGELGNPGCDTASNWFRIEMGETPGAYKLVWDPSDVCSNSVWRSDLTSFWAFGKRPVILGGSNGGTEVRFGNLDDVIPDGARKVYKQ